jgi:predicted RNA-binding protein with PIN domain|tara:strand:+ start:738 stop:1205 length:468 start_codon:yes stop_codon:yes gene_type:complete
MAIVRILVDGYSLLHTWRDLASGEPRHSARAREALIHVLTQYADSIGTPVTLFFDGNGAPKDTPKNISPDSLEIVFSRKGKTADDLIERTAYRLKPHGEALAVTNDYAERDTVISLGGTAQSCEEFICDIERILGERDKFMKAYNRREANRYKRH